VTAALLRLNSQPATGGLKVTGNTKQFVWPWLAYLLLLCLLGCTTITNAAPLRTQHHRTKSSHHKLHQAGWAGAGFAAGKAIGPAGSAAVGATKYRKDLKAGGHRRTRAVAKISAPIAAGAVAGPAGTIAYEAVDHRNWIKRHIFHRGK
jgi:hypothetical protein